VRTIATLGRWAGHATLLLVLAACGREADTGTCSERQPNLLQDPQFSTLGAPRSQRRWFASEHAAGRSFEYAASDGVLTVRKTGREPWFLLKQIIKDPSIAGRDIVYSADIRLDLHPPAARHGFKTGGGLVLTAHKGGRIALNSVLEHEPHMGSSDWQPVSVRLSIPPGVTQLRPGILHQADGTLQVRNPRLSLAGCDT